MTDHLHEIAAQLADLRYGDMMRLVSGILHSKPRQLDEPTLAAMLHTWADREDLPGLVTGWGPERMQHLAIGVRNYLEDLEKGNRSAARTGNKLMDAVLAPGNQDKLRAVLGDARADPLIEAIRQEESMHGAPNRIIGGSPTADRQAARNRYLPGEGIIDKLSVEQLMHPGRAIGKGLAKVGLNQLAKKREAAAAQLRDELSRIMTTQGADRNAIARALIGAPEPPPSTWARPGGIVPPQAPAAAAATASARPQAVWSGNGWRAVSADELAQMQAAARARQAAQTPVNAPTGPAQRGSPDLLRFLAARGGLSIDDPLAGDVRSIFGQNPKIPGYGNLLRKNGLYDHAHGRKRYPIGEEHASPVDVEAFQHSDAQDILHALEQEGAHIPDDRIGARIVDLVRNHGMHPEMAHECAIMEDSHVRQDDGLPALPAQAAARLSDVANATSSARVQAQPAQGQPAGAGTGSPALFPGQANPAAAQRGIGPHSEAVKQVAAVREANRLGLMPRIQQMALHGKSDAEIAMAIGGQLSSSDVRLVRHHLGIGSTSDLMGGDEIPFARGGGVGFAVGGAAGGADDETFRADLEAAGLCSPRASGGRAVARPRVKGEMAESDKATHEEVHYLAKTPNPLRRCAACTKYISSAEGGPACKRVASPINMHGVCNRFVRATFDEEDLRTSTRNHIARGEKREDVLKRMRQRGIPIPAGA
jgi:hypothetical protein